MIRSPTTTSTSSTSRASANRAAKTRRRSCWRRGRATSSTRCASATRRRSGGASGLAAAVVGTVTLAAAVTVTCAAFPSCPSAASPRCCRRRRRRRPHSRWRRMPWLQRRRACGASRSAGPTWHARWATPRRGEGLLRRAGRVKKRALAVVPVLVRRWAAGASLAEEAPEAAAAASGAGRRSLGRAVWVVDFFLYGVPYPTGISLTSFFPPVPTHPSAQSRSIHVLPPRSLRSSCRVILS